MKKISKNKVYTLALTEKEIGAIIGSVRICFKSYGCTTKAKRDLNQTYQTVQSQYLKQTATATVKGKNPKKYFRVWSPFEAGATQGKQLSNS